MTRQVVAPYIEKKSVKRSVGRTDSLGLTNKTMQRERVYMPEIGLAGHTFKQRKATIDASAQISGENTRDFPSISP